MNLGHVNSDPAVDLGQNVTNSRPNLSVVPADATNLSENDAVKLPRK